MIWKKNQEWITGGPWYNTSICKNLHGNCLRDLLEIQELTDIISCVLLMHMKNSINHLVMMLDSVGVFHYHQIQQHTHWFRSVQPYNSSVVG